MLEQWHSLLWTILSILLVAIPLIGSVAYLTLAERKFIGYMQIRQGPNRTGILGLGQPLADGLKLLLKEIIIPSQSNKFLFILAPILVMVPALVAWSVVPFNPAFVLANVNAGVLVVLSLTSLNVYGILLAGWASNSKYAFLGAIRACSMTVSYEIAMGFALVGVLLAADSLNIRTIVLHQQGGIFHWYLLPLFPMFMVFWIAGVAETNRAPFDIAEGESEIVAGFHVEYSGITFALFFLAEYAGMILVSALTSLFFLGGWLSPFEGLDLSGGLAWLAAPSLLWFLAKISLFLFLYIWMRATFPRYRYDQIMRLGWKILIPIALIWIFVEALAVQFHLQPWFGS